MSCEICVEKFDSVHKKVICPYCQLEVCSKCVKSYLLDTIKDPHCMKCRKTWNRVFLYENMGNTFVNYHLKKHRENILIHKERGQLPHAMRILVHHKRAERINKRINKLSTKLENYRQLFLRLKQSNGEDIEINPINPQELNEQKVKKNFMRACLKEDCRGFMINWKCELCETHVCKHCLKFKEKKRDNDHICEKEDVLTARILLSENIKPCPKCGEGIHKISGCDMMFCTGCNTGFSWKTGEIVQSKIVHNPHYYEWINRNINRNINQLNHNPYNPCANTLVGWNYLLPYLRSVKNSQYFIEKLESIHRAQAHLEYDTLMSLRPTRQDKYYLNLRILYLKEEIDEKEWKVRLQRREKANEKKQDMYQIVEMCCNALKDLFRNVMESKTEDELERILSEMNSLRQYTNKAFKNIGRLYKNQTLQLNDDWELTKFKS